jgi:hypothetical protein
MEQLYQLKFDKLWHTFEECISNNVFEKPTTRHAIFSNGDLNEQSTTRKDEARYNEGHYELGN